MVGATVEFAFDPEWDGLTKTAVFIAGSVTKDVVDITDVVTIPHEVMTKPGLSIKVGVYGTNADGTVVIPTVYGTIAYTVLDGADPSGDPSADPTLPPWVDLQNRVKKLEENPGGGEISPEAIKNAVEDYLDRNPVEAPVESVNGQTGTVKLTAEDVGAISEDKLQEATNEALAQAKASGEFDGVPGYTPVKGVDYFTPAEVEEIAQQAAGMVEVPDGGNNAFSELFRLKTTEEVKRIETGINLNEYSEIYALCNAVSSDGATTSHFAWLVTGYEWLIQNQLHATQKRLFMLHGKKIAGNNWFFETGFVLTQNADITNPPIGSPGAANTIATSDKWTYACYTLDHITKNFAMGAYTYADVNLASGAEVIVFGR